VFDPAGKITLKGSSSFGKGTELTLYTGQMDSRLVASGVTDTGELKTDGGKDNNKRWRVNE
jgi:hypothetical protein